MESGLLVGAGVTVVALFGMLAWCAHEIRQVHGTSGDSSSRQSASGQDDGA